MSVHGEYQRALRAVLTRISESESLADAGWVEKLERAQLDETLDLSTAARVCLDLLARLEAEFTASGEPPGGAIASLSPRGRLEPLRDACHHLRAHCHAILGVGTSEN